LALFRLCPNVFGGRHVQKRHAERADLIGKVGVVGDDHHHRHVQLTATIPPEQVKQAVIVLRRHDRDPFGFGRLREPEVHLERRGHPVAEVAFQGVTRGGQSGQVKDRALHERPAGLFGRMLIEGHDVCPGIGQERTDGRHQPRPVAAAQQQSADVLDRQRPVTHVGVLPTDRRHCLSLP